MIPGWPYSVVAGLEPGRSSWTAPLDAVRLSAVDDETEVTATQVHNVAIVLCLPASKSRRTRAANSGSACSTSFHAVIAAVCARSPSGIQATRPNSLRLARYRCPAGR